MKHKVSFNQRAYEVALNNYKKYKESVQNLNTEAKVLNVTLSIEDLEQSTNPFTLIATKHFETLGVDLPSINPIKYLNMTDIDTTDLSIASNKYMELKKFSKMPLKEDFTVYLSGEQAEEYKMFEGISETLNKWKEDGLIDNPLAITRAMRSRVIIGQDMKFKPALLTR